MGRAKGFTERTRLATTEARSQLPKLVGEMRGKEAPSGDLFDDAICIGPHRKGGAVLLPEVDFDAAVEELEMLRDQVEDLLLMRTLEELYQGRPTGQGKRVEQVARELGFADMFEDE
jgi:hypothetical protein